MKRFAAGAVAVATALSLSTGVASAANTDEESALTVLGAAIYGGVKGVSEPHSGSAQTSSDAMKDSSSKSQQTASSKTHVDFYESSWNNDANNKYKLGTTADILWGFGIAAAVLAAGAAAVNAGVIPGVSLPF